MTQSSSTSSNDKTLFWASFLTLIAAGMGFSIRGAILADWGKQFGFTQSELGAITGGGLIGFGITIIVFSFIADLIGYGKLMLIAFLFHLSSAVVTLAATYVFDAFGKNACYNCLYYGSFLFALGNGTCEAVINPLTATLYPKEKTHWLNILHAGWPGGLILGALLGLAFENVPGGVRWEIQLGTFVIPTLMYGFMMFNRPFPRSEANASGVTMGTSLLQLLSPILLFLFLIHAMVGYVELGTDSWISNITGSIMEDKSKGLMLFVWTSGLMFALRFFAGPIVHQISPLGLLFVSAVLGAAGLWLLGNATSVMLCVAAATVYGLGKTFFWPTMLGVVSERYPKGGALTLGICGGIGMLSAGFLGGPAIGYKQDYFATEYLQEKSKEVYERYKADKSNQFPVLPKSAQETLGLPEVNGLNNSKIAIMKDDGKQLATDLELVAKADANDESKKELRDTLNGLNKWWNEQAKDKVKDDKPLVVEASLQGGRQALIYTAAVPATMAVCYLLLIIYFKMIGGYKQEFLSGTGKH